MAAAALSRSRGVAGVRTTKGPFFIFTLLCLVCFASSLTDKDKLEKLKEYHQESQQELDSLKAERDTISELMSGYVSFMKPVIAIMKNTWEASPHLPPVEEYLEYLKDFVAYTKSYVDKLIVMLDEKIENTEQNLRKIKKIIHFLEEQQAEL